MARLEPVRALLLLGALLLAERASATQTNEYQCRRGELLRRVQLGGSPAGQPLPCEVVYWKDTERPGSGQILWNATIDQQYCEDKASAFVEQLRGWGWRCDRSGAGWRPGAHGRHGLAASQARRPPSGRLPERGAMPGHAAALAGAIEGTIASLGPPFRRLRGRDRRLR